MNQLVLFIHESLSPCADYYQVQVSCASIRHTHLSDFGASQPPPFLSLTSSLGPPLCESMQDYWVGSNIICNNPRKTLAIFVLIPQKHYLSYNWGSLQLLIKPNLTQYMLDVGLSTHTYLNTNKILRHHN